MSRKFQKRTHRAGVAAWLVAALAITVGLYIDYQLRKFGLLGALFGGRERGWRDQAFSVSFWSAVTGGAFLVVSMALKRR